MDATYRADLRELNELNFARFEAKLEQRVAELRAEIRAGLAGVEARLEARMAALETRVLKWMFVFWVGQAATTVALVFGVVRLVGR